MRAIERLRKDLSFILMKSNLFGIDLSLIIRKSMPMPVRSMAISITILLTAMSLNTLLITTFLKMLKFYVSPSLSLKLDIML